MDRPDDLILRLQRLSREMIILADRGQAAAPDDGCRLLFGVLQDCAYKLRQAAEREQEAHARDRDEQVKNPKCHSRKEEES